MAKGLQIGDALGSTTMLGSVSVRSSPQIPSQHYAQNVLRVVGNSSGKPYDYLKLLEVRQQVGRQDRPFTGPRTCGVPGAPPCMTGDVQSAPSGLGDDSSPGFFSKLWDYVKNGPPGSPSRSTPEERDAYEQGVRNLPEDAANKLSDTAKVLNFITKPWFLGVAGGVIVLFVAAPYVVPFLRKR